MWTTVTILFFINFQNGNDCLNFKLLGPNFYSSWKFVRIVLLPREPGALTENIANRLYPGTREMSDLSYHLSLLYVAPQVFSVIF